MAKSKIYSDKDLNRTNDNANDAYKAKKDAEKKAKDGASLPLGGKSAKMGESLIGNQKAAEKAYDKDQNMREEEVEIQRERERRNRTAHQMMREVNDEWDAADPTTVRRDNKVKKN